MQVGNVSCIGQRFAPARCSSSQEKKPRRRRTKEERRAMVESFITKYRGLNNGNFPSLNLTHKEVGGSFYTIREIVRDIIQENKVLGPGSLSLKTLNLEDCEDPPVSLSEFSSVGEIYHNNVEVSPVAGQHQNEDSYELVDFNSQKKIALYPNVLTLAQVSFGKSSDQLQMGITKHADQYGSLADAVCKDTNLGKPTVWTDDNLGALELNNFETQGCLQNDKTDKAEQKLPSVYSTCDAHQKRATVLNDDDLGNGIHMMVEGAKLSAKSSDVSQTNRRDDDMIAVANASDPLINDSSSQFSFPASSTETSSPDLRLRETESFCSSKKVFEMQESAEKVEVPSMSANGDAIINRFESSGIRSSSLADEEAKEQTASLSQQFVPPSGATMTKAAECKLAKSSSSTLKDAHVTEGKAGHEDISSSTSEISRSKIADKERSEANPFWAAMKAVVDAFVKFWTE
ncbi:uncharacterized protein LOC109719336 [Ananas comosus]|uniref:Uncharacterized protein LOC109719336 n=1 Tax=Ananas comosus TaxID=4615 RepID=A0A6P5FYS1_ANACO|nr:uncharacterized protein LOC109719336 [Ananas comosus]